MRPWHIIYLQCSLLFVYSGLVGLNPSICTVHCDVCLRDGAVFSGALRGMQHTCDCATPCRRVRHETVVSHAATSNFDTRNLFLGTSAGRLRRLRAQYSRSLEMAQRTNRLVRQRNRRLLDGFVESAARLDNVLALRTSAARRTRQRVEDWYAALQQRAAFHERKGLRKLAWLVKHNFVRGWTVADERTFTYVTTNYREISHFVAVTLDALPDESTDDAQRVVYYLMVKRQLEAKRVVVLRAVQNLTEIHDAFVNCTPLLTFKCSPKRRYDLTYITKYIIHSNTRLADGYYKKMIKRLNSFMNNIDIFCEMLDQAFARARPNTTHNIDEVTSSYEFAARSFNYNRFLFQSRVVQKSVHLVAAIQDRFKAANDTVARTHADLLLASNDLLSVLDDVSELRRHVDVLRKRAADYRRLPADNKTSLATLFTSPLTTEHIRVLLVSFSLLASRTRRVTPLLVKSREATRALWTNMLTEEALKPFYAHLQRDVHLLAAGDTQARALAAVFAELLDIDEAEVLQLSATGRLAAATNGDFVRTSTDEKLREVDLFFDSAMGSDNVEKTLQVEDRFVVDFRALTGDLTDFLRTSKIDERFYK